MFAQSVGGRLVKEARCNASWMWPSSSRNLAVVDATFCSRSCPSAILAASLKVASSQNDNAPTSISEPMSAVPRPQQLPHHPGRTVRKHRLKPPTTMPVSSSSQHASASKRHPTNEQWLNAWDGQLQSQDSVPSNDGVQRPPKSAAQASNSAQRPGQYVNNSRQSRQTGSKTNPAMAGAQLQKQLQALGINASANWISSTVNNASILGRLHVPQPRPDLTTLQQIVIVEGYQDCKAVHRAVNAVVYVCDGASIKSDTAAVDLQLLNAWPGGLIILTDPDAPGRELRMFLDDRLVQSPLKQTSKPATSARQQIRPSIKAGMPEAPDKLILTQEGPRSSHASTQGMSDRIERMSEPCSSHILHAFVPVELATSTEASKWHEEGSTGIENANPAAISQSLQRARPSFPETRKEFTVQELQNIGLLNSFDSKQVAGAKLRRLKLCSKLGIDPCTGKSLCSMLNRFFTRAELDTALKGVDASIH